MTKKNRQEPGIILFKQLLEILEEQETEQNEQGDSHEIELPSVTINYVQHKQHSLGRKHNRKFAICDSVQEGS
jgi:hypothetical protein